MSVKRSIARRCRDALARRAVTIDSERIFGGRSIMSTEKLQAIVDQIKDLTLVETSNLVKMMEDTFGVSAAAAAVAAAPAAAAAAPVVEEKEDFDVVLTGMAD